MAFAVPQSRALMRVLAVLALALAFAVPAFPGHACATPDLAAVTASADLPDQDGCPDCGPACSNGCCHAPHPAMTPEIAAVSVRTPAASVAHADPASPSDARPDGPERPPRA